MTTWADVGYSDERLAFAKQCAEDAQHCREAAEQMTTLAQPAEAALDGRERFLRLATLCDRAAELADVPTAGELFLLAEVRRWRDEALRLSAASFGAAPIPVPE